MQEQNTPEPLSISAYTLANALGAGREENLQALRRGARGLVPIHTLGLDLPGYVGVVPNVDDVILPPGMIQFDCRNHRLAEMALRDSAFLAAVARAREQYGKDRVGVFVGTSTSGIAETEQAYRQGARQGSRDGKSPLPPYNYACTHSLGALAEYVGLRLDLAGPAHTTSTACSSSAKVFGVAQRFIAAGFCDAAVVGGVDSLCETTLRGFGSLQLLSEYPATPWGRDRSGISIGEAAGFALLEPLSTADDAARTCLLGVGESADAHHMSAPHPQGDGASSAILLALEQAGCRPASIDYINLHGTGTPANDLAEDKAVSRIFGEAPWCSSTKGATGHTLGAAGITEALFCCIAREEGMIPGGGTGVPLDPELEVRYATEGFGHPLRHLVSLSLGFGGSNCCLVMGEPA